MKKRIILVLGTILILAGLAVAGYPVFLKVQGALEQSRLEKEFQDYLENPPYIDAGPQPQQPSQWPESEVQLPQWEEFPPTKLRIPSLDVDVQVVAVDDMDIYAQRLNQPPGYYPQSAMPGAVGNVLIAGHRGGPAGYFLDLDQLEPGHSIVLHAPGVEYYYVVEEVFVVEPTAVEVLNPTDYPALTLTTCQRVGAISNARRLIVRAMLDHTSLVE